MNDACAVTEGNVNSGAVIDGAYRYHLWRQIEPHRAGTVLFIMLNPSTADHRVNDPTIRRCIGFTRSWGCGRLEVVNLFALRATDPKVLAKSMDPVGPDNDTFIRSAIRDAVDAGGKSKIVVAWGTHGTLNGRSKKFVETFADFAPRFDCLGVSKEGHPKHPLYIAADQALLPWGRI